MKILFYNHTGQVSGAERVLQMILRGLDRDRYEGVVACPKESKLAELMSADGVPIRGLSLLEARFTWRPDRLILNGVTGISRSRVVRFFPAVFTAN